MPSQASDVPLDARLAAAFRLVRRGGRAADIGSDHGKLAAALLLRGQCTHVIASDVREAPLARTRALLERCGCLARAEVRLGDGLSVLRPGEVDDIVIGGLSGVTIGSVLAAGAPLWKDDAHLRFILIPASKHAWLRRFLCEAGLSLLGETPVCAAGRWYTVMHAAPAGEGFVPDALFCAAGRITRAAGGAGYLEHAAACLEKQARGTGDAQLQKLAEQLREL